MSMAQPQSGPPRLPNLESGYASALGRLRLMLLRDVDRLVSTRLRLVVPTVAAQKDGSAISDMRRVLNFQGPGVVVSDDAANGRANIFIAGSPSGSPSTNIYTVTGSEKILTIAAAPYTFPANWQTAGFNDSAWGASVDDQVSMPAAIDSPSSSWQGTGTLLTAGSEQQAYRHTFTLPGGSISTATLQIWADNYVLEVYVNGTALSGFSSTQDYPGSGSPAVVTVPTSALVVGGTNVIAVKIANFATPSPSGRMRLNWKLAIGQTGSASGYQTQDLGADVAMASGTTYYDGPNLPLTAGTWHVTGRVTVATGGGANNTATAKLWDGFTLYASAELTVGAGWRACLTLDAIVTLSAPTTLKVSCATDTGGATLKAATLSNGSPARATSIRAVKIA